MDERREFDIHIAYYHSSYGGESDTEIRVTFPSARAGQDALTLKYTDQLGTLSHGTVAENAGKDIAEYMQDPEEWMEKHILESGTNGAKLRELRHSLAYYESEIVHNRSYLETSQKSANEVRKQIAALEAKMRSE